jgi:hypothetical protein
MYGSVVWDSCNIECDDDDDDDKLYLTTLTLSAEAGFHNGRVKNINKLLQVK